MVTNLSEASERKRVEETITRRAAFTRSSQGRVVRGGVRTVLQTAVRHARRKVVLVLLHADPRWVVSSTLVAFRVCYIWAPKGRKLCIALMSSLA